MVSSVYNPFKLSKPLLHNHVYTVGFSFCFCLNLITCGAGVVYRFAVSGDFEFYVVCL